MKPEERVTAIRKFSTTPATLFSNSTANSEPQLQAASAVSLLFDEKDLHTSINFSPEPISETVEVKVGVKAAEHSEKATTVAAVKRATDGGPLKQLADPFRLSPYRLNQFTKFHRIETVSKRRSVESLKDGPAWYEGVEEVHLERRKLKSMYCFDRLPNLRRLFLSGNEISKIEGLENCTMLEELILEDNLITKVSTHIQKC